MSLPSGASPEGQQPSQIELLIQCIEDLRDLVSVSKSKERANEIAKRAISNKLSYTITDMAIRVSTSKPAPLSYAATVKQDRNTQSQAHAPKVKPLFLKLGLGQSADQAVADIKQNIDPVEAGVSIVGATAINEKTVKVLLTNDSSSIDQCKCKLSEHFPNSTVEEERKLLPRIVIFNVPENRQDNRLLEEIFAQNESIKSLYNKESFLDKVKVIRRGDKKKLRGEDVSPVTIQVSGSIIQCLKLSDKRQIINLAYLRCPWIISDTYLRCRKCLRTGHNEKNCTRDIVCSRCGGNHSRDKCNKYSSPHCHLCTKLHKVDEAAAKHDLEDKTCIVHKLTKERQRAKIDMSPDHE